MLTLVSFLVAIGIIAMVHELGHYMMAKKMGVGVKEFSIGFGPKLWACKREETEYSIRLLPIAGFVDLVGMDPNEEVEQKDLGFNAKPASARMAVLVTGALMNIVLAAATFWFVLFFRGVEQPVPPVVSVALRGKPAAEAGIKAGDRIVAINGKKIDDWFEMRTTIALHPERPVELNVERNGSTFSTQVTPIVTETHNFGRIYIYPNRHFPQIGDVLEDTPAEKAGIKSGDIIVSVAGKEIDDWREMQGVIRKSIGQSVEMTVLRDSNLIPLNVTPEPMKQPPPGWFGKFLSRFPGKKPSEQVGVIGILCNFFPPVVEDVKKESAAGKAGLIPGDRFKTVVSLPVQSLNDVFAICKKNHDKKIPAVIERDGATIEIIIDLSVDKEIGLLLDPPVVGEIAIGSPADKAGLRSDAWIFKANGKPIFSFTGLTNVLSSTSPGPVEIEYKLDGIGNRTITMDLPPRPWKNGSARHALGIYAPGETVLIPLNFSSSFVKSMEKTWDTATGMVYSLYLLFSGKIRGGVKNVMGPIGIANITGKYARSGIWVLINWVALLSTYIGLFNLMPFPALDGGRLAFIFFEAAIGRRINARVEETIHTTGLFLLL